MFILYFHLINSFEIQRSWRNNCTLTALINFHSIKLEFLLNSIHWVSILLNSIKKINSITSINSIGINIQIQNWLFDNQMFLLLGLLINHIWLGFIWQGKEFWAEYYFETSFNLLLISVSGNVIEFIVIKANLSIEL